MSGRWVDLREAAELLDTSAEAVRKRAARGSLRSERRDGRVLVWVDEGRTEGGREAQVDREALLEAKDETIRILEEQLRLRGEEIQRRAVIISQLTQANAALAARVPELEAAESREESAQGAAECGLGVGDPLGDTARSEDSPRPRDTAEFPAGGSLTRPWWRRVFRG